MNETWVLIAKSFLQIFPFLFSGGLSVYFIDEVLRYRLRYKRVLYPVAFGAGLLSGALASVFALTIDGEAVPVTEIIMIADALAIFIICLIGMTTKIWRRIVVILSAIEIMSSINNLFMSLEDAIYSMLPINGKSVPVAAVNLFIAFQFLMVILEFLFFYLIARIRRKKDDDPLPIPVIISIAIILSLVVTNAVDLLNVEDTTNNKILLTFILGICLLGTIAFFYARSIRQERNDLRALNEANEELISSQTKYFEASAKADNEIRAMRHDMKNNIQVLSLLLENGDYDQMREYMEEMGENLSGTDISAHTGNTIADAIIAEKTKTARDLGIELSSSGGISGIELSPVDTCKILANMLNNAIEAVSKGELAPDLKKVDLAFRRTGNFFLISCRNPCADPPVIMDGGIVTSKDDRKHHGFGIKTIKATAENYGGEVKITSDGKPYGAVFTMEILFPVSS